jgi:hypothetical protein
VLRAHERDIAGRTTHGERCAQILPVAATDDAVFATPLDPLVFPPTITTS